MSSPIIMSAPPTAAEPSPGVACVAMASRKKAGLSSMRSSRPRISPRAAPLATRSSETISAMVSVMRSYIDCTQARRRSSRLEK